MIGINEKYVNEVYDDNGVIKEFSLNVPDNFNFAFDIVDEIARIEPDKKAMVWCNPEGEEHIFTFADIKRYSDKTANFLRSIGIKKGDMVMLLLKRHYEYWFAVLALHKLGAVAIPGVSMLTTKDLVYRFNAASIKAVISTADGETAEQVDEAQAESPTLEIKIIARGKRDGWLSFHEGMEAASEHFERPQGDEATKATDRMLMYFTSGTTGFPKMVSHDFAYPLGHIMTAKHWQNVQPDGLHLTVADTGWAKAGWGKIYGQWIMETCLFIYDFDRFDAEDLLTVIEKYNVTSFCAPPTIYRFLIKEGMGSHKLSSLKYAATAGEALNAEVFNKFYQYTGIKIMEGFGQTEGPVLIATLHGMEPKPGSLGKPVPLFKIDLIDEEGKPVPRGEVGEIAIDVSSGKPAGLFDGYYRDEENTKKVWHDGYYHTRDTAWCDEDGYFWYVGRTDDVIKSSGYRIGPFEIESVLMEHPAVLECAVTGAPDPVRGQVVKASIVLTRSYQPSEELKKEIKNYVKEQTAPYKYPRIIDFVSELPKTSSGKIQRAEIRKQNFTTVNAY
ncbi:MAG TPA: AMP-binding protein [Ruminiclostridium sp.]|nr:AMP-binding protein [Ruminiclostridium sp.]